MKQLKIKKADLILLAALLLIGAVLGGYLVLSRKSGAMVSVRVDGEEIESFPLDTDLTYEIQGIDGGTNLLVIKDGKACLTQASCPDKLCVNMGEISGLGQSIICLPNHVVVEIADENTGAGNDNENTVDIVVGGRT